MGQEMIDRLKDIKARLSAGMPVSREDADWLIQEAERLREFELQRSEDIDEVGRLGRELDAILSEDDKQR